MAVAAGRAADPGASAQRVVMVSRNFPLLEGGNGAVLLAGLSLGADVPVAEVLGGAPAVLDQAAHAEPGTLVIAADDSDAAVGAAALLTGDSGADLDAGRPPDPQPALAGAQRRRNTPCVCRPSPATGGRCTCHAGAARPDRHANGRCRQRSQGRPVGTPVRHRRGDRGRKHLGRSGGPVAGRRYRQGRNGSGDCDRAIHGERRRVGVWGFSAADRPRRTSGARTAEDARGPRRWHPDLDGRIRPRV